MGIEKAGFFYLGKMLDKKKPLLYESKNLTTHAVCVGMTGSGKTGLGIALLEEAALDKIPAIIIDPKGDLGNLLLTFPKLSPEEFEPWVDPAEAERKGITSEQYAAYSAKMWKEGLSTWGESAERIQRFRDSVDLAIYTPASQAGIPISILASFAAPSKEQMSDVEGVREKIVSITSSLLGLLGIDANPLKSREFILISTIINHAWESGRDLDLPSLVQLVQNPPFAKVGALDLDTFYPPKERIGLSIILNNLLASPGFQAWMEGEPLDIQQLLYTSKGKPKLSIISIAHLSDAERMFFVTLLLDEVVAWMRSQPGTSNLRALLYMDEIFGFFPPTAMPPSKLPMLTLLKTARAFGVGIVLATQNPVDLDYKGLANCGTWFIGKLQTERDKMRVVEGLKVTSKGDTDASSLDKMLASTGNRTFILRSIYEKEPILFQTRWTLSYLRGPLTLAQITKLSSPSQRTAPQPKEKSAPLEFRPSVPPGVQQFYLQTKTTERPHYAPRIGGVAKLHYVNAKNDIDTWEEIYFALPVDQQGKNIVWEEGSISDIKNQLQKEPLPKSTFADLAPGLMRDKNYPLLTKQIAAAFYQNQTLTLYQITDPKLTSKAGESESDFRIRALKEIGAKRDDFIKKVREKYAKKEATLREKLRRAQQKLAQKQEKASAAKRDTMISAGSTLLGAIFGRKLGSQTGSTLRRAAKIESDAQDIARAQAEVNACQQQLQNLMDQMEIEISAGQTLNIETLSIKPRKSDIAIEQLAIVWWSY